MESKSISIKQMRAAGLETKRFKRNGRVYIAVRNPRAELAHQKQQWWIVTEQMRRAMSRYGILEGFEVNTLLADVFSNPID